jgi:hypothetical protein
LRLPVFFTVAAATVLQNHIGLQRFMNGKTYAMGADECTVYRWLKNISKFLSAVSLAGEFVCRLLVMGCYGSPQKPNKTLNYKTYEHASRAPCCQPVRVARRPEGASHGRKTPHPADGRNQRQAPRAALGENQKGLPVQQPEGAGRTLNRASPKPRDDG